MYKKIEPVGIENRVKGLALILKDMTGEDPLDMHRDSLKPTLRYMIAEVMHREGYSFMDIAAEMNLDHATLVTGTRKLRFTLENDQLWGDQVRIIWKRFCHKVC